TSVADQYTYNADPNSTWQPQCAAITPGDRYGAGMAYDAANHATVLFGGGRYNGGWTTYLGDTWTWDGSVWTLKQPAGSPSPRLAPALAYDTATSRTI